MSTQVNFELRLPDTGSIPSEELETMMLQLKAVLKREAELFLAKKVAVPPALLLRGPTIVYLKN